MSITPEASAKTLTQMVATRIRVAMAVEDIRQSELSRRMGKNEQWLSVRLRGRQPIDMNDLLLFARALEVNVHDLLPSREEAEGAAGPPAIPRYLDLPVRMDSHVARMADRPPDNRPVGKPAGSHPVRTVFVDRRGPSTGPGRRA